MTRRYQHSSAVVRMICLGITFSFIQLWVKPNILHPKCSGLLDYYAGSLEPESQFYPPNILKQFDKRKVVSFELTGEENEDSKILEIFRYETLKLRYTLDTSQIIRIKLHATTTYETFIGLLHLMYMDGHRRYFEWDGYFYVIFERRDQPKISYHENGTLNRAWQQVMP